MTALTSMTATPASRSDPLQSPIADKVLDLAFWKTVAAFTRDNEITFQNTSKLSGQLLKKVFIVFKKTLKNGSTDHYAINYESFSLRFSGELLKHITLPQIITLSSDDSDEEEPISIAIRKNPSSTYQSPWQVKEIEAVSEFFSTAIKQIDVSSTRCNTLPGDLIDDAYTEFRKTHPDSTRSKETFTSKFRPIAQKIWKDHLNSRKISTSMQTGDLPDDNLYDVVLDEDTYQALTADDPEDYKQVSSSSSAKQSRGLAFRWPLEETKSLPQIFSTAIRQLESEKRHLKMSVDKLPDGLIPNAYTVFRKTHPNSIRNESSFASKFRSEAKPLWVAYFNSKQISSSTHDSNSCEIIDADSNGLDKVPYQAIIDENSDSDYEQIEKTSKAPRPLPWSKEEVESFTDIFDAVIKDREKTNGFGKMNRALLPYGFTEDAWVNFLVIRPDTVRTEAAFATRFRLTAKPLWEQYFDSKGASTITGKKRPAKTSSSSYEDKRSRSEKETELFSSILSTLIQEIENTKADEDLTLNDLDGLPQKLLSRAWDNFQAIILTITDPFVNDLPDNFPDFSQSFSIATLPLWQDYIDSKQASMSHATSSFHSSSSEAEVNEWFLDDENKKVAEDLLKTADLDAIEVQANE